jgi:hypothetical protein
MTLTAGGKVSLRSLAKTNGKKPAKSKLVLPEDDRYVYLMIAADYLTDMQDSRVALEGRIRSLEQVKGQGGKTRHQRWLDYLKELERAEHKAKRELEAEVKHLPFNDWIDANPGVGYVNIGRLLGVTGDPAERETPSQLVAYCGLHVVNGRRPRRTRGEQGNWNSIAKAKAFLVADGCLKAGHGPYRDLYDQAKAKADSKVHTSQCQNTVRPSLTGPKGSNGCGTQAHPELGAPGTAWRPGHQHRHALGVVARQILIDLWVQSQQA